ncbi:hypothetical protein O6161_25115, partial [Salmonella enterica subsp. enterica]
LQQLALSMRWSNNLILARPASGVSTGEIGGRGSAAQGSGSTACGGVSRGRATTGTATLAP